MGKLPSILGRHSDGRCYDVPAAGMNVKRLLDGLFGTIFGRRLKFSKDTFPSGHEMIKKLNENISPSMLGGPTTNEPIQIQNCMQANWSLGLQLNNDSVGLPTNTLVQSPSPSPKCSHVSDLNGNVVCMIGKGPSALMVGSPRVTEQIVRSGEMAQFRTNPNSNLTAIVNNNSNSNLYANPNLLQNDLSRATTKNTNATSGTGIPQLLNTSVGNQSTDISASSNERPEYGDQFSPTPGPPISQLSAMQAFVVVGHNGEGSRLSHLSDAGVGGYRPGGSNPHALAANPAATPQGVSNSYSNVQNKNVPSYGNQFANAGGVY